MENPGAVTFTEDFVFRSRVTDDKRRKRAMVVAHEMAHMWFGDLVTMRWWDDLWLNESFAELLGFFTVDRATRFERTWEDFSASRKAWGYRADALPSTHPVQGDVPDNRSALLNFDGISYAKGASVLRQLMATVGEDAFFAGVQAYMAKHAFANTSFDDLLAELETASGRDLQEWARAWLQTTGTSVLRGVVGDDVRVVQESPVHRSHRIGVGLYDRTEEGLVLRDRLDVLVDGGETVLDLAPSDAPDLLLPNDGDLTFAKVRLDERSLATARTDLRRLPDAMARALVWASLWDATRDAELPAAHFVEAVLAGVEAESDPAVAESLLGQARTAALLYSADGTGLLDALAEHSHLASRTAPAGSDLQLVHARAFAAAARGFMQPTVLSSWLVGQDLPDGLAVDTDLRWHLVQCLAALGELGEDEIAAELHARRHRRGAAARHHRPRGPARRGGQGAGLVLADDRRPQRRRGPRGRRRLLARGPGRAAAALRRPLRRRAARGLAAALAAGRRDAGRAALPAHAGVAGRAGPDRSARAGAAPGGAAPLRRRAAQRPRAGAQGPHPLIHAALLMPAGAPSMRKATWINADRGAGRAGGRPSRAARTGRRDGPPHGAAARGRLQGRRGSAAG